MLRALILTACTVLSIPAATAQVTVIGAGIARECYETVKFGLGSLAEAEKTCTRAIELEAMNLANKAATYTNRGVVRMRMGNYDGALEDYAVAKRIRPETGATWLNEGAALIFKKDYPAALASLEKAIELNSEDLYAAYYNRAIAREKTGDVEGAYFDFVKAKELNPGFERIDAQLARFTLGTN